MIPFTFLVHSPTPHQLNLTVTDCFLIFAIVTIPEHHQDTGVLSCTIKFLPSSWFTSLICSQRSHGRLTCNTWRAWLMRGHPVWLLPIHPTHVALSSARNTCRRSSKVSCTSAPLCFSRKNSYNSSKALTWNHSWSPRQTFQLSYIVKQWNGFCVSQWPPDTAFPFWLMKSTPIWWVHIVT